MRISDWSSDVCSSDLSPVHALFAADSTHFSPYAPSSRLFFNVLHADPAQLLGGARLQQTIAALGLGDELEYLERQTMIDWPRASRARLTLLRAVHAKLAPRLDVEREPLNTEFTQIGRAHVWPRVTNTQ